MQGIYLDSSIIRNTEEDSIEKADIQLNHICFEFPEGLTQLRLIEECRALNALDLTIEENFDLMYDITMQMLTGKAVFIYFVDDYGKKNLLDKFVVTDRYMNMRSVNIIDEYPIIVNWLVEFIAGYLGKKYPRSLENYRAVMSEREKRMKTSLKEEVQIRTSFMQK